MQRFSRAGRASDFPCSRYSVQRISTIVITYNEAHNIEHCLKSVAPFSDEIIVVDSHSSDETAEIARRYATVFTRDWPGYGKQKQWALEKASNPWVFSIDADEKVSPSLLAEIQALRFDRDGYYIPRQVWYLNRWIRHSGWYPDYVLRLFRKESAVFTDKILHESAAVAGNTTRLTNPLFHYSYRDISHHLEKMNMFTSLAAQQMHENGRRARIHQIALFPPMEFFKMYVAKRGFLDGVAGLVISSLHAFYVFLKYAKLFEMSLPLPLRRASKRAPQPATKDPVKIHSDTRQ